MTTPNTPEPAPQTGQVEVMPLVIADLQERYEMGKAKYGTPLMTHNGRNGLIDLYQELLDACLYIRQLIEEQTK